MKADLLYRSMRRQKAFEDAELCALQDPEFWDPRRDRFGLVGDGLGLVAVIADGFWTVESRMIKVLQLALGC